jgi:ArsR family transcriptional regulator
MAAKFSVDRPPVVAYICIMTQISKQRPSTPKAAAGCCGPIDGLLDAELFKGLSDATRLKLLGCMAKCGRACSVTEMAECCSVDYSVVSRHLALLERSGIVESAKEGRAVLYRVKYAQIAEKLRALAAELEGCCPGRARAGKKGVCCGG